MPDNDRTGVECFDFVDGGEPIVKVFSVGAIIAVDIGHTDTDHTTCLHVPSIDLVVAGDAIYNGTHP